MAKLTMSQAVKMTTIVDAPTNDAAKATVKAVLSQSTSTKDGKLSGFAIFQLSTGEEVSAGCISAFELQEGLSLLLDNPYSWTKTQANGRDLPESEHTSQVVFKGYRIDSTVAPSAPADAPDNDDDLPF